MIRVGYVASEGFNLYPPNKELHLDNNGEKGPSGPSLQVSEAWSRQPKARTAKEFPPSQSHPFLPGEVPAPPPLVSAHNTTRGK